MAVRAILDCTHARGIFCISANEEHLWIKDAITVTDEVSVGRTNTIEDEVGVADEVVIDVSKNIGAIGTRIGTGQLNTTQLNADTLDVRGREVIGISETVTITIM